MGVDGRGGPSTVILRRAAVIGSNDCRAVTKADKSDGAHGMASVKINTWMETGGVNFRSAEPVPGHRFRPGRLNPRSVGVWLVTRPAGGGGGGQRPPLRSPKLLDRFPNFKRHSIALYVKCPYKVKNLTRKSLMTSQVRSKSEFSTFRAW